MDAEMAMPGYTPLLPPQGAQYHPLPGQGQRMPITRRHGDNQKGEDTSLAAGEFGN